MRIDVERVKASVSLVALMERDGVALKPISGHFRCLCPFHREKTPSCHVWPDHLHCWGCAAHEDAIGYIRKTRSLTFPEAIRVLGGSQMPITTLNRRTKEVMPEPVTRDFSSEATRWLAATTEDQMNDLAAKLGVGTEPLWWLGAGWSSEHRAWSFPMRDGRGTAIGIRLRDDRGKKWAVIGSRQGLFIPCIPPERRVMVTEGPTDAAACLTLGFYAIGRPSCNGSVQHVLDFLRFNRVIREVVLVTDNDGPGIKGADDLRKELPCLSYQILLPPKDIRRFVQIGGGRQMIESMIRQQVPQPPPKGLARC
jgi:hypothetical protein